MRFGQIILFLLLFFSAIPAGSNDPSLKVITHRGRKFVSFVDIIEQYKLQYSFEIITGKCRIYRGSRYAVFNTGHATAIINGRFFKYLQEVIRYNGAVLIPEQLGEDIFKNLYPGRRLVFSGKKAFLKKYRRPGPQENYHTDAKVRDKITFIVIDPGHGGKDPGALSKGGAREKNITLKASKHLYRILKQRLKGIEIHMTRWGNKFIELSARTAYANKYLKKHRNGIFISVHVNASLSSSISGFETYFLSQNPTNEDARSTAALENNVIVLEEHNRKNKSYDDIDYIEAIMLTTQIQKESTLLAKAIQKGMDKKIWRFKSRGVRKADFFVLRGALMPAALVEIGFITNNKELKYLKRSSYQKKIASGIADGIVNFLKEYNKMM